MVVGNLLPIALYLLRCIVLCHYLLKVTLLTLVFTDMSESAPGAFHRLRVESPRTQYLCMHAAILLKVRLTSPLHELVPYWRDIWVFLVEIMMPLLFEKHLVGQRMGHHVQPILVRNLTAFFIYLLFTFFLAGSAFLFSRLIRWCSVLGYRLLLFLWQSVDGACRCIGQPLTFNARLFIVFARVYWTCTDTGTSWWLSCLVPLVLLTRPGAEPALLLFQIIQLHSHSLASFLLLLLRAIMSVFLRERGVRA